MSEISKPAADIYFLIFSSIVLFFAFTAFIIIFFRYYRKKQRHNFIEKEELKSSFKQELLQAQIEIQEEVFNSISQEIHDNVGQILSLAKIQANIILQTGTSDTLLLSELKDNVGKALSDLRDIAKSLSSQRLRGLGIHIAVGFELERVNKTGILNARIFVEGSERTIEEQKKLILFRILQESLQNIIRHSSATEVNVSFYYKADSLTTIVQDNGIGFNIETITSEKKGLGLDNIKFRAALAGGRSELKTNPGEGTTITIDMPYE